MKRLRLFTLALAAAPALALALPAAASAERTFKVVGGQLDQKVVWESKSANTMYGDCYDIHGEDSGTTHYSMQPIKGDKVTYNFTQDKLRGVKWAGTMSQHASRKEWLTLRSNALPDCQNPPPDIPYAHDRGCVQTTIKPGESGLTMITADRHYVPHADDWFMLWGPFVKEDISPHCYSYDSYTSLPIPTLADKQWTALYHLKRGEKVTIKADRTDDSLKQLGYEFPFKHHGFATAELKWSLVLKRRS